VRKCENFSIELLKALSVFQREFFIVDFPVLIEFDLLFLEKVSIIFSYIIIVPAAKTTNNIEKAKSNPRFVQKGRVLIRDKCISSLFETRYAEIIPEKRLITIHLIFSISFLASILKKILIKKIARYNVNKITNKIKVRVKINKKI
jgi:hypothetical protein